MKPPSLHIRPAKADDAAAIAQLVNAAYRPPAGSGGWTHESALLDGQRTGIDAVAALIAASGAGSVVLTGLMADTPVGCVLVETDAGGAHIGMLAVSPAQQTAGLGKQLLAAAEEWAHERFGSTIALLTVIGARPELKSFYLRRGYHDTGRRLPYPAGGATGQPLHGALDLHVLEKSLQAPGREHATTGFTGAESAVPNVLS